MKMRVTSKGAKLLWKKKKSAFGEPENKTESNSWMGRKKKMVSWILSLESQMS